MRKEELRPGRTYRVRHRAGSRTVTHVGEVVGNGGWTGERLILRIPIVVASKVHRLTGYGPATRPGRRDLTIYPDEFLDAEEVGDVGVDKSADPRIMAGSPDDPGRMRREIR